MKLPPIDKDELMAIASEVKQHGQLDHEPGECDYCDWIRSTWTSGAMEVLISMCERPSPTDLLIFLYFGIQLGRNQVLQEELEAGFGPGRPA
jgi:hypothetical protein